MPGPVNHQMTPLEWGTLLVLAMLWGGSFFFVSVALSAFGPVTIAAIRVAVAAIVLVAVNRLMRLRLPADSGAWRAFAVMAVLNNVIPFSLLGWGQSHIAGGLAAILNATTPVFGAVIAHVATADDRLTPNRVFGVLVAVFGVAVMVGLSALEDLGVDLLAELACIGAALFYGLSGVYGRRFGRAALSPITTAAGQMTAASLMLVPLSLAFEQPLGGPMPAAGPVAAVLALGLVSSALAYILYFRLLASAGATNTLLVTLLVPAFAILFGVALLGEILLPRHFLGLALIALGLLAIDGRLWRTFRRLRAGTLDSG